MSGKLEQRGPMGGKENPAMVRKSRRPYGTGCILQEGRGLAIRWYETIIDAEGKLQKVKRYEALGAVSRKRAAEILADKTTEVQQPLPEPTTITFAEHAEKWRHDILPTYKPSVRIGHGGILRVHLIPKFGPRPVREITTMEIQSWITDLRERKYAPNSIDHFHEVMNAVMRTAVTWYGLEKNPAHGVQIGRIKPVRKKWALTTVQANALLERLPLKPRTMVALDITTGLRRGELEAVRWEALNESEGYIRVKEHHYRGNIDDPKTEAGFRNAPVSAPVLMLLQDWKKRSRRTAPTDFIFATRNGKPESGNNILRRHVYPACDAAQIARANWLTFRRTFSNWSHEHRIPAKDIAEMMGHAEVDMQFTYTVGVDENKRRGAERLGNQLVRISQISPNAGERVN
jgi:integrase